jgi:hypothetical protein
MEADLYAAAEAAPEPTSHFPAAWTASAQWQCPRNRAYMLAFAVLSAWLACVGVICLMSLILWGLLPLAAALGTTICGI